MFKVCEESFGQHNINEVLFRKFAMILCLSWEDSNYSGPSWGYTTQLIGE
jgi:hypothetical protein